MCDDVTSMWHICPRVSVAVSTLSVICYLLSVSEFARIRGAQRRRVCGVPYVAYHLHLPHDLPDYTEPEPKRRPRPPKGEGEAARNNVVMSAGKRRCPDIICYLLQVLLSDPCTWRGGSRSSAESAWRSRHTGHGDHWRGSAFHGASRSHVSLRFLSHLLQVNFIAPDEYSSR